jgi:transposase InsO family protein
MSRLDSYHCYDNILDRDFNATKPNQKWVTDITYILTPQGWAYLSTIKDLFDGFIVAHQLGKHNSVSLVTNTSNQRNSKKRSRMDCCSTVTTDINTLPKHILS